MTGSSRRPAQDLSCHLNDWHLHKQNLQSPWDDGILQLQEQAEETVPTTETEDAEMYIDMNMKNYI